MKRILYIIAFAAALLAASSCVEPLAPVILDKDQDFTLSFSCGVMTKATVEGDGNENLVKRIDYFVFPYGTNGKVADTDECVHSGTIEVTDDPSTTENEQLALSYTETIPHDKLVDIFPDGNTKAVVFAVANYVDKFGANNSLASPNTTLPDPQNGEKYTWGELHAMEVGATFFYDDGTDDFGLRWPHTLSPYIDNDLHKSLFFVMAADSAEISLMATTPAGDSQPNVNGIVPLERLASKVTVNFTYENVVEQMSTGNITWVPQATAGETRVYLSNAIEHTTLGGPLTRDLVADSWTTATQPLGNGTRDIFEYAYNFMNDVATIDGKKTAHFYTYPIQFEEGDDNQPYLKLVLPWYGYKNYGTDNQILYKQKEVYYKIVLPRETITEPNRIYEYSVNVNIIGNDKEVNVTGYKYEVKDWLTHEPISSNVATGKYISLDIPKDYYDMYTDLLDISFVSSGKVVAHVDSIVQWNYSGPTPTLDYFMKNDVFQGAHGKGVTAADVQGWVTIPEGTSYLRINHELCNDINVTPRTKFDVSPYIYVVTLHLDGETDDTFDRTVTITQYPSLYVTSKHSNGYVFINRYSNDATNYTYRTGGWGGGQTYRFYAAFDDRRTYPVASNNTSKDYHLGNISYERESLEGTGTNDNPNNYVITVSILPDTGDDVIGDPRSQTVNNLTNLGGLSNYRPTQRTETKNIIAPKFIVSSSYSALTNSETDGLNFLVDLATAEKRCAAYQENGYPAGRWRVPTFAEIKFMATLSKYGFIPSLFNFEGSGVYWSANGSVSGNGSGEPGLNENDTTSGGGIRCVYDAWYWGEEPYQENATTWLGFHD